MEISNATLYKLLENRPPVYFQVTCRTYHVIFHAQHTRIIMLPCCQQQLKVASCMVSLRGNVLVANIVMHKIEGVEGGAHNYNTSGECHLPK